MLGGAGRNGFQRSRRELLGVIDVLSLLMVGMFSQRICLCQTSKDTHKAITEDSTVKKTINVVECTSLGTRGEDVKEEGPWQVGDVVTAHPSLPHSFSQWQWTLESKVPQVLTLSLPAVATGVLCLGFEPVFCKMRIITVK